MKKEQKELSAKVKGANAQAQKLQKKGKAEAKVERAKGNLKLAQKNASAVELEAAQGAAKAKHRAYKAAMTAAHVANEFSDQKGPQPEMIAADNMAKTALKASKI